MTISVLETAFISTENGSVVDPGIDADLPIRQEIPTTGAIQSSPFDSI
jgi:hypothetical protein